MINIDLSNKRECMLTIEDAIDRYLLSRGIDVVQFMNSDCLVDKDINDGSGSALSGTTHTNKG